MNIISSNKYPWNWQSLDKLPESLLSLANSNELIADRVSHLCPILPIQVTWLLCLTKVKSPCCCVGLDIRFLYFLFFECLFVLFSSSSIEVWFWFKKKKKGFKSPSEDKKKKKVSFTIYPCTPHHFLIPSFMQFETWKDLGNGGKWYTIQATEPRKGGESSNPFEGCMLEGPQSKLGSLLKWKASVEIKYIVGACRWLIWGQLLLVEMMIVKLKSSSLSPFLFTSIHTFCSWCAILLLFDSLLLLDTFLCPLLFDGGSDIHLLRNTAPSRTWNIALNRHRVQEYSSKSTPSSRLSFVWSRHELGANITQRHIPLWQCHTWLLNF